MTTSPSSRYADSLGFLSLHGAPPVAHADIQHHVALVHVTAAPPTQPLSTEQTLEWVTSMRECIHGQPNLQLIECKSDLTKLNGSRTGVVLGLQQAPYDLHEDPSRLGKLANAGIRIMGFSYGDPNHPLCAGCHNNDGTITDAGWKIIEALNEREDIILDVSHMSRVSAHEVAMRVHYKKLKLAATHGGIAEVYDHPRNLHSYTLRKILERKGYVGIYALTFGLDEKDNDIVPLLDHIFEIYRASRDGLIGIGTDSIYHVLDSVEWEAHSRMLDASIDPNDFNKSRWPDYALELNVMNRLEMVKNHLTYNGMSQEVAAGITGENFIRFLSESLPD